MNIEELRAEANALGFSIAKKIAYEKLCLCPCSPRSRGRIGCEIGVRSKYYRCTLCGYKGEPAKYKYQAIMNWNKAVYDKERYKKHSDEKYNNFIKQLEEKYGNVNKQ